VHGRIVLVCGTGRGAVNVWTAISAAGLLVLLVCIVASFVIVWLEENDP
jgi:hypothetical protein